MTLLGWIGHVGPRVFFDFLQILLQVDLSWCQELGLLQNLPSDVQDGEHSNHSVREEECWEIPVAMKEDRISAHKSHDKSASQRIICHVGLAGAFVWQGVAIQALCITGLLEAKEGKSHDREVDQLRRRNLWLVTSRGSVTV